MQGLQTHARADDSVRVPVELFFEGLAGAGHRCRLQESACRDRAIMMTREAAPGYDILNTAPRRLVETVSLAHTLAGRHPLSVRSGRWKRRKYEGSTTEN